MVLFGSNPANDQPVMLEYLAEAKQLGTRVLVVNTLREPGLDRPGLVVGGAGADRARDRGR